MENVNKNQYIQYIYCMKLAEQKQIKFIRIFLIIGIKNGNVTKHT